MAAAVPSPCAQAAADIRFEWGLPGALAVADPAGALVIVDVLSFTTSVTVAADRGTAVYPHCWPDPGVEAFATAHDAVRAVRRNQVSAKHPWSLSPAHLLAAPAAERLVLPSPDGSTIAVIAARGSSSLAVCAIRRQSPGGCPNAASAAPSDPSP